jgi:hypothetical protein
MKQTMAYAYLKTIDGEEVVEYTEARFHNTLNAIKYREIQKSDRTLYFVAENSFADGIKLFKDDYFEILK